MKTTFIHSVVGPPKGVRDRLIAMKIVLTHGRKFQTVISPEAPQNDQLRSDRRQVLCTSERRHL